METLLAERQEHIMRSRLLAMLAMLVLLGVACVAHADYIVIIADLNAKSSSAPAGGGAGMVGGMPAGGALGVKGGPPAAGMLGGAMVGGPPPGAGMAGGALGIVGGKGGPPPGGIMGGPPPGGIMGGPPPGGMMGSKGGPPPGSGSGAPPGAEDVDDIPNIVVTVVEVGPKIENFYKLFEKGLIPGQADLLSGNNAFKHHWGSTLLRAKTDFYQVVPLRNTDGKILHSTRTQFKKLTEEVKKDKATTDDLLKVATWALEHNLLEEFVKEIEKIAEKDKTHPIVVSVLKTKADLARAVPKLDLAKEGKGNVLPKQRLTQPDNSHFAILHAASSTNDMKSQVERLEMYYHSFFYWWALRGVNLPLPVERQLVVVADRPDLFRRLHSQLTAGPVVSDSFFARREGFAVFGQKRTDSAYGHLEALFTSTYKEYDRRLLIKGKGAEGTPFDPNPAKRRLSALLPRTYALMMKSMEDEWEANAISHEVARQLMFSTGLLPRNVHVPEWIQFGTGSFFEMPLQSPWGGAGAPSPYWLPRFREYVQKDAKKSKDKQRYGNSVATLKKVVTDSFFRAREPDPDDAAGVQDYRALQRYGEAASWSLTYYLAHREQAGLRKYFKELARMPRDIELDDQVLLGCFARAFDCVTNRTINDAKLKELADRWLTFINDQPLEADAVHKQIRDYYAKMTQSAGSSSGSETSAGPAPATRAGPTTKPRQPTSPRPGTGGIRRPFWPGGRR